ncbi:hypothetical protein [Streptomyces olivochromogenes]|uniref:hypothetical protein n=1 Tax=Streptomyces olivochromogenes TaxID=1963 RepID=UPI001F3D4E24|nr:hypothetical protein [Streptomyces olivochromogenes]MCF3133641.1 hypothetical protein [Streptomyces olivochromogenes]
MKPESRAAGKAYSNGHVREYLRRRGIRHSIPEKTIATRYDKRGYAFLGIATAASVAIWL